MDKQNIPVVPDENRMEELLGKIQPVPSERFHERIKHSAWRTENLGSAVRSVRNQRVKLAFAMTILLVLAGFIVTPRGRAWAQEVFQFFSRINARSVELPESQVKLFESANDSYDLPLVPVFIPTVAPEMAALPGCETAQVAQSYACQVALAESKLGVNLKELPATPEN